MDNTHSIALDSRGLYFSTLCLTAPMFVVVASPFSGFTPRPTLLGPLNGEKRKTTQVLKNYMICRDIRQQTVPLLWLPFLLFRRRCLRKEASSFDTNLRNGMPDRIVT